jgi:hypothetical protein
VLAAKARIALQPFPHWFVESAFRYVRRHVEIVGQIGQPILWPSRPYRPRGRSRAGRPPQGPSLSVPLCEVFILIAILSALIYS